MADDVVAIVNTSPDIVDMLRMAFQRAGIVVVSAFTHSIREGDVNLEHFIRQHDPRVIVYDIAPPYDANWQFFQHLSQLNFMKDRVYVLTSTNTKHVASLVGRDRRIYEIVGRPIDIDEIVQATREALRSRHSA